MLTNGDIITPCVDVESIDGWAEIDEPDEPVESIAPTNDLE
jgi:hypothetical protein